MTLSFALGFLVVHCLKISTNVSSVVGNSEIVALIAPGVLTGLILTLLLCEMTIGRTRHCSEFVSWMGTVNVLASDLLGPTGSMETEQSVDCSSALIDSRSK